MSKIFVAWSGDTAVAKKLAAYIKRTNSAYDCIVGGNLQQLESIFVGGTIIDQMRQCDQAILLIQKHKNTGRISANLMFEWGYLLAKLKANKIHNFLIDMNVTDNEIPSDLRGIWANEVKTEGLSDDEIAKKIGDIFFAHQRFGLEKDKMTTILDRYEARSIIRGHNASPVCTNYELAQYVLCYTYTANLFRNIVDEALKDMRALQGGLSANARQCRELVCSVRYAVNTLETFKKIQYTGDEQFISRADFYPLREEFEEIIAQAEDLDDSEVKWLVLGLSYNLVSYLYLLYLNSPEIEREKVKTYCRRLINYSLDATGIFNDIEADETYGEGDKMLCILIRAYLYRNAYCGEERLEKEESAPDAERTAPYEERRARIKDYLLKSFKERKTLYNAFSNTFENTILLKNIEMEYYLSMAECWLYEDDEREKSRMRDRLARYIERVARESESTKVFANKIRGYIGL